MKNAQGQPVVPIPTPLGPPVATPPVNAGPPAVAKLPPKKGGFPPKAAQTTPIPPVNKGPHKPTQLHGRPTSK